MFPQLHKVVIIVQLVYKLIYGPQGGSCDNHVVIELPLH